MYTHFLEFQLIQSHVKYHGRVEKVEHWDTESSQIILALGKLAFEQLERGNLIFYETDLKDCGINVSLASIYSGLFTEIFREERGLHQVKADQDKMFCFVHLSIQEFIAAL